MTPHDIEVLMHYYMCLYPHPRSDSIFVKGSIQVLQEHGLLTPDGEHVTKKGKTFVKSLCSVPVPAGDAN